MKTQLTKFLSIILLLSFGFNFAPLYSDSNCVEESCAEKSCEMSEKMTCCTMVEMEKESCQCPEMTNQDKEEKEKIPAIPVTTITKLIANLEFITLNTLESTDSSKRNFNLLNASHYSTLSNKIYKKINTFLI